MGYRGVKFDDVGENSLAAHVISCSSRARTTSRVWPEKSATAELQWPMKGWK